MGACCSAAKPAEPAVNNVVNELDIKRLASETHCARAATHVALARLHISLVQGHS
jgi:hypothetical protein